MIRKSDQGSEEEQVKCFSHLQLFSPFPLSILTPNHEPRTMHPEPNLQITDF